MIALYFDKADFTNSGVAYSYDELHQATFTPSDWDILILDGSKGKTYEERKDSIRNQAILYSYYSANVIMDWSDCANLSDYFTRYGNRYGLMEEFHENGIC